VGFLKVRHADTGHVVASLKPNVERDAWSMEYEDALRGFFQQVPVGHEKIGGLPWTEIDFPEDVARAEKEVLPRL
jgi:choline kinase